jgi:galactokinase
MGPSTEPAEANRDGNGPDAKGLARSVESAFLEIFGYPPRRLFRAPGRVNLIGEHTDYNDGFVLPMAIDRSVWMAVAPADRRDRTIRLGSLDLAYAGNVPIGAGLSSSAAVEVAIATAARDLYDLKISDLELAQICQQAEHEFVGTQCGLMDQLISIAGQDGCALLIDCRYLTWEPVPIPANAAAVICDTGKRRSLVDSAYNERRAQCEEGARRLGVAALRDLGVDAFEARAKELPPLLRRRCRHVVRENDRTLRAAEALRQGCVGAFGQLMNQSHASLRDLYEVSCEELDLMAALAQSQSSCWGARMTGAGFGGCIVALVERDALSSFARTVVSLYERQTMRTPALYACQPSPGAGPVS